jgi:hypothetical protein
MNKPGINAVPIVPGNVPIDIKDMMFLAIKTIVMKEER